MRILLFFDLPMVTTNDLREYRNFLKSLKRDGFYMLQESVYVKMALDNQVVISTKNKIKNNLPKKGNVMVLSMTEKQFSAIDILLGSNKTDVINSTDRIIIL